MSTEQNKQPNSFQQLLGELGEMTKSFAPPAEANDGKKPSEGEEDDDKNKVAAEGDESMAKSFQVTLADGSVVEAQDGTELVKSLFERVDNQESMMVQALGGTLDLVKSMGAQLTAQSELIKSLQDTVGRLSNQGAGRKTLVNVHEQVTTMTKSLQQPQGPTKEEIMAKSNAAFAAGKISGHELTTIDVAMRAGVPIDQALAAKVMQ
jgi:hypothetical protein